MNEIKVVLTEKDDQELLRLPIDSSISKNLSESRWYSESMPTSMTFRVEKEKQLIGEICLKSIRWYNRKAELSIFILEEFQGNGYGKQAIQLILNYFFDTMNMYRLEAEIYEYNKKSQKLFENFGFILEGKLRDAKYFNGKYYDILRYGLLRREYETLRA